MGFDLSVFTLVHVLISVLGIVTGLVAVGGMVAGRRLDGWIGAFLLTTIATSVSGFGFATGSVTPPQIVGALSLLILAVCLAALYWRHLDGRWRAAFVVTAVLALYLNVFVLVVQLFLKTPPLAQLAPTQQELPFILTQGLVLLLFAWLGWSALHGFRNTRQP